MEKILGISRGGFKGGTNGILIEWMYGAVTRDIRRGARIPEMNSVHTTELKMTSPHLSREHIVPCFHIILSNFEIILVDVISTALARVMKKGKGASSPIKSGELTCE